jgi:hypothetical protein
MPSSSRAAAQFTADGHRPLRGVRLAHHVTDGPQHRRVERVVEFGDLGVVAIDRQQILR